MKRFLLFILFAGVIHIGFAADNVQSETSTQTTQEVEQNKSNLLSDNEDYTANRFTAIARGALGMVFLIFIAFIFSSNRKAIDWKMVGIGLVIQLILAFLILKIGVDLETTGDIW